MVEGNSLIVRILLVCLLPAWLSANAQLNEVLSPSVRSVQVIAGDRWTDMPVIELGGDEQINISFDDLTHSYHRYIYKVEHCEADWTVSEGLFDSDWFTAFNSRPIDDNEQSLNTNTLYTHYTLSLPNDDTRLTASGNYRVSIIDDETEECILRLHFMIVEPILQTGISYRTNTDTENRRSKQQVEATVNFGPLRVTNLDQQLTTVFLQNGRWDNARWNTRPDYQTGTGLRWEHQRELIFDGGNTYRKFELLDMQHPNLNIDDMHWDGNAYHAFLVTSEPRLAYSYDEAATGAFLLRNSDNYNNDTETDYAHVHFSLKTSQPPSGSGIYINASWTQDRFDPQYRMQLNPETGLYEAVLPLKQGYYSYQYLLLKPDGTAIPLPSEGNFHETANTYQLLVYYRGTTDRTDRLVGFAQSK